MINKNDPMDYLHMPSSDEEIDEFDVWSNVCNRWFTGSTLTIARANRATAERVYREHHAKNTSD